MVRQQSGGLSYSVQTPLPRELRRSRNMPSLLVCVLLGPRSTIPGPFSFQARFPLPGPFSFALLIPSALPMTRSQCDSLRLHCVTLAFTTTHRLRSAHPDPFPGLCVLLVRLLRLRQPSVYVLNPDIVISLAAIPPLPHTRYPDITNLLQLQRDRLKGHPVFFDGSL